MDSKALMDGIQKMQARGYTLEIFISKLLTMMVAIFPS